MLKEGAEQDTVYQRPKEVVKAGRKPKDRDKTPDTAAGEEPGEEEERLGRGELREGLVNIGHSAHQGVETTKRQLRV